MIAIKGEKEVNLFDNYSNNINSIHEYLTTLSDIEFIELINKNMNFPNFPEWMNYYLWLFRKEKKIQYFLNLKGFPNKFIVGYIYYSFGKWLRMGNSSETFFMEITQTFTKEKSLQILLEEDLIDLDANLALSFISNLNEEFLNQYLDTTGSNLIVTEFFLNLFNELEDDVIKTFFIKNPELYGFILNLFKDESSLTEKNKAKVVKFNIKFKEDIEMLDKLFSIKEKVFSKYNMAIEMKKPYNKRNFDRISFLIKELKNIKNIDDSVQILYRHFVIIEKIEKDLIKQVLKDEFIGSLFDKS